MAPSAELATALASSAPGLDIAAMSSTSRLALWIDEAVSLGRSGSQI